MRRPNKVVKRLRTELGLTQAEFAGQAEIHPVYLCQIETGTASPIGATAAVKILNAFKPKMEELDITLEDVMRGSFKKARSAA